MSEKGLVLAHRRTVGLLGFQGGKEVHVFRFWDRYAVLPATSVRSLRFDTSRFIWIGPDIASIHYRPLLETDPALATR